MMRRSQEKNLARNKKLVGQHSTDYGSARNESSRKVADSEIYRAGLLAFASPWRPLMEGIDSRGDWIRKRVLGESMKDLKGLNDG